MPSKFTILSPSEQLAIHLRGRLLSGIWGDEMPGAPMLAAELGVNHKTIIAALQQLEHEGLLVSQGPGRKRRIILPEQLDSPSLRVAILDYEPRHESEGYMNELYHLLGEANHTPFFTSKCLTALGMDVKRIARMVKRTAADAWVVGAGSSEVLAWFTEQEAPAFALFGRHESFPIAAIKPNNTPAISTATRRLIELGHRRISFLCRRLVRLPQPGKGAQAFLAELEGAGIHAGDFNLPDWDESREGFAMQLDSMFRHTPPTALILDEPYLYGAALHFLAGRGMQVPEDISLVCIDADRSFAWCQPSVAHIRWDYRPVIRRIVRWANNVSRGKKDIRQTIVPAEFVEGGTVGKAPAAQ
jgi:DNA-binding LacI/PurR family transcriptional regulator